MSDTSNKVSCNHCHLVFDTSVMLTQKSKSGETEYFCCKGCQGVYNLLNDSGLDNFYERTQGKKLSPVSTVLEDSELFDSIVFEQNFVKDVGELKEISLIIEGIHCSACVWLNEKVLTETFGVVEASINFSTNKAKILWDPSEIKLSLIIDTIRSIGYDAYAYDPAISEGKTAKVKKEYHRRLIVATFAAMNIMWIAIAQYAGLFTGIEDRFRNILNNFEAVLATPVLFYSGWVFFRGAYYGMRNGFVNMDLLVATGATLTYIYSFYIMFIGEGEAYFDSVVMIITFVLLGKFLEVASKKSASDTLDILNRHVPMQIRRIVNEDVEDISVHDAHVGDRVLVYAGERFAVDGIIAKYDTYVDESSLTGENDPVRKNIGDSIVSGTSNITQNVEITVTKSYEDSTFSKLLTLLDDALSKKPKIENIANIVSGYFSTIILLLAIVTFAVWLFMTDFNTAFMVGISVIVIACPCALALATPIASLVGVSMGAKNGVLFKEAAFLETMAKTTKVFFDKTGTLTNGNLEVINEMNFDDIDKTIISALVEGSIHPVSKAILRYLDLKERIEFSSYELVSGKGIKAEYRGDIYLGGSKVYLESQGIACDSLDPSEYTQFLVAKNSTLIHLFELEDEVKEGAKEFISYLKSRSITPTMLTGDHDKVARSIADQIGIENVHASLTPQDKLELLQENRLENDVVVMVGDGINDILVLANADIGIAMGSGADVSIDSSDIVLLSDDMKSLKEAFEISSMSFHLIKQNLKISLLYNVITIPLAMAGYIIPLIAALSMSLSSLLVVANSLRVKWMK
jgi:P-type Cu+ transporter